jgi:prepilin-type N-terminal cleavage/methylation domain-containing protein
MKGYTLTEVLIVLAILAFMSAMALPFALPNLHKTYLEIGAKELRNELKHCQYMAKFRGKQVVFAYCPRTPDYSIDKRSKKLPYDLRFGTGQKCSVVFYPNGRCEDLLIGIRETKKQRSLELHIQGMTGRITIKKP